MLPYQGGPDIRLAPSNSPPFYPLGQSGQQDICLWKKIWEGSMNQGAKNVNKERLLSKPLWDADVPFSWDQCCQNTELVYYKHGTQRAIVFKHHHNPIRTPVFCSFQELFMSLAKLWRGCFSSHEVEIYFGIVQKLECIFLLIESQYPFVLCWYNIVGHSCPVGILFLTTFCKHKPSLFFSLNIALTASPCQPANHSPWITKPTMQ